MSLPAGVITVLLAPATAEAGVPPFLATATVQALLPTGAAGAGVGPSVLAASLAKAAVRGMFFAKLEIFLLLAVTTTLLGVGAATFTWQEQPNVPAQRTELVVAHTPVMIANGDTPPPADKQRTDSFGDPLPAGALLRLGTLRHRYLNRFFFHTEYLPDGKTALTGTFEEVRWVDIASGRLLKSWPLPKGLSVAGFSHDGRLTLLTDGTTVHLWDLVARRLLRTFDGKGERTSEISAGFAADGKVVAVKYAINYVPGLLRVFDVATGRELWQEGVLGGGKGLRDLGFLPDGKTMLFEDADSNSLRIVQHDRRTGRVVRSFDTLPRDQSRGRQLSPDGSTLFVDVTAKAVGDTADKTVRAWDVATGRELPCLSGPAAQVAEHCGISRDGKVILTGGYPSRFVLIWDWPSAKQRGKIDLGAGRYAWRLRVSADGKRAEIDVWGEHALRFFDLETGKELAAPREAHRSPVNGLAIAPDGKVVTAGTDNTIRVWDSASGRQLHEYETDLLLGPTMLGLSGDGRLVATATHNGGKVLVYERDSGRLLHTVDTRAKRILSVAFAPHGRLLAISTGEEWFLVLWDINLGREKWRTSARIAPVFSADGRLLAAVHAENGSERVQLLEAASGREVLSIPFKANAGELAFSPDGRMLAARNWKQVVVWELATAKERWRSELAMESRVVSSGLQFSPDGRWLARADYRFVLLYDVLRGQRVHSFAGHDQTINRLAFAPDGRTLASASFDTTVLIWDMAPWTASPRNRSAPTAADVLQAAWKDLASDDAKAAFAAVRHLVGAGAFGLALLRERMHPAKAADPKHLQRLLADLGSDRFADRNRAKNELERLADMAEAPLRRFLNGHISLEARRRAEAILARLQGPITDAGRLQQLRALEVLEHIGSPAARDIMHALAKGAPEARLTREAQESLRRMTDLSR